MNRPPRPRFMNNTYRCPRPYHHQWRPNHAPPARFPWGGNPQFGALNIKTENSEEHWCETCDRGFLTADLLHKHKQQHQKCNIDGCQFVAHPKVITKHIQMQHSTGLYKKIANLNNPEEIQKWREERKKKYPTKINIEKKAAERKEKIERGERMALEHNNRNNQSTEREPGIKRKRGYDKRNQNQRNNRQNFKRDSFTTNNYKPPAKKIPKPTPCAPSTTEKNKLLPFTGILNIDMEDKVEDNVETIDCSNSLIEDDDYEASPGAPKETQSPKEPALCGALSSLMCDYGTSDEEPEEKENEVLNNITVTSQQNSVEHSSNENKKNVPPPIIKPELIDNKPNESDDDGPEEVKIVKTNIEHETAQEIVTKIKEKPLPMKKVYPPKHEHKNDYVTKRKIPSTLLQKLLHTEIRQERNIVLQCIRFIKKNNYFDKA